MNGLIEQVVNFEYDLELRHLSKAMTPQSSRLFRKLSKSSEPWDICRRCSLKRSQVFEVTPKIRTRICTIWPIKWSHHRLDSGNLSGNLASFTFRDGTAEGTMP